MDTQRSFGRAWGNHITRWTVGLLGAATFLLLTGCADCISDSAPESIPYCLDPAVEAARGPGVEPGTGCIAQP